MLFSVPETAGSNQPSTVFKPYAMPGAYTSLLERWQEVVTAFADRDALVSQDSRYTFEEADRMSDLLALSLVSTLDPADEHPIGVLGGQTADVLVALLAVLKSGRMHVVLDPHLPTDRHQQYLELAGITTIVADAGRADAAAALAGSVTTTLRLEALLDDARASTLSPAELHLRTNAELIFARERGGRDGFGIVFTSGSTGTPKGVVQTHQEGLNEVTIHQTVCGVGPADRCLLVLPLSFVAGIQTFFSLVLAGASVWCFDARDEGVLALADWVETNELTTFASTPYLARAMGEAMEKGRILSSVRYVWTGGEAVTGRDIRVIRGYLTDDTVFINCLGSTEAAVLSLWLLPYDAPIPVGTIPSGHVVANKTIRILREDGSVAGTGETGQVAIVSDYIAGGYWNDPVKDAASFKVDDDGNRYFLQGDLGRLDENGGLLLGGRADAAVKVRGYLVEPAEVEAGIMAVDGMADAVVIAAPKGDGTQRLIAYVVPSPGLRAPSSAALRRALRTHLPEYMVPSEIVQLEVLPRTERGKVDRKALPPVPARVVDITAMDQRELAMSTIWQEVLELPEVGLDDDFMAVGGDSLSAEELLTVVEDRFGVSVPSTEMLKFPTLREFTARVAADRSALPSHPDLVTLNAAGTETPFFGFAGAGALAMTFLPLSRRFPDSKFYAFQAHGLETRAVPDWSVEAMADRFIALLRIVQAHGPYRLAGHSFGGIVAMEVARRLREGGEEVEMLAILDTYLFEPGTGRVREVAKPTVSEGGQDAPVATPRIQTPFSPARALAAKALLRLAPDGLPHGENVARQARAYLAGVVRHKGKLQYDSFLDQAHLLTRRYAVKPYAGPALLVLVDENPQGPAAWRDVLVGPLSVRSMHAEHTSLLREPGVTELARLVEEFLSGEVAE